MPEIAAPAGLPCRRLALPAGVPDGVALWRVDVPVAPPEAGRAVADSAASPAADPVHFPDWPLLDAAERARALRLRMTDDRLRFVAARGALRRLLGTRLGCDPAALAFRAGAHGKPMLDGATLQFNVSHSGAHALIALSEAGEVGVDIERIAVRPALAGIAAHAFHPDERAACGDGADAAAFFAIWSGKEAVFKAAGTGLSDGMRGLCVLPDGEAFSVDWPAFARPVRAWRVAAADGYSAALALLG
ncbi:4'-phosphopantetheinyl transferase family protein [Derxia lacustris]|uniref:4'-phosphopantetheinyl transferase family protein n=1 Tax=Derxia lacustris TaxID=764842 RepID=UPI000A16F49D|nr:4'-phosphopantetheinyl transferase superfamily protein [Derxia lacustris]